MMHDRLLRSHWITPSQSAGYTLVELMVALAVSSIVIAGTYGGYAVFARQQQLLQTQTEYDRNAMRAIDLISTDIRMAGYKDYLNPNAMTAAQPISILATSPGDLVLVFDDYDVSGSLYRALIHYYLQPYSPVQGKSRNRLFREWRKCNNPSILCSLGNSTPLYGGSAGEPLLDWVTSFAIEGLHKKTLGSFATQYQTVKVSLSIGSGRVIEGTTKSVSRNYVFVARARNVSLIP